MSTTHTAYSTKRDYHLPTLLSNLVITPFIIPSVLPPTSAATGARFIQSSGKTGMSNTVVVNRCPYFLYLWLVDRNESPPTPVTIRSKSKHVEPFRMPCVECGISLGVSKTPSLSSVVQFEYALNKSGRLYL